MRPEKNCGPATKINIETEYQIAPGGSRVDRLTGNNCISVGGNAAVPTHEYSASGEQTKKIAAVVVVVIAAGGGGRTDDDFADDTQQQH